MFLGKIKTVNNLIKFVVDSADITLLRKNIGVLAFCENQKYYC